MLKKITVISLLVLLLSLIVAIVSFPFAVRDFMRNGDKILSGLLTSTPISSYAGDSFDTININIPNSEILIEQSSDNTLYMRMEGVFADKYNLSATVYTQDGTRILEVRPDSSDAFFQEGSSYLLRRNMFFSGNTALILRVPRSAVITTPQPYRVTLIDGVEFQNSAYYEEMEWQQGEETNRENAMANMALKDSLSSQMNTLLDVCVSEMDAVVAVAANNQSASSIKQASADIDALAVTYLDRIRSQLFPFAESTTDVDTLHTLLDNYMNMLGESKKYAMNHFLLSSAQSEEYDTSYQQLDNAQRLENMALEARDTFFSLYFSYLENAETNLETPPDGELAAVESSVASPSAEVSSEDTLVSEGSSEVAALS